MRPENDQIADLIRSVGTDRFYPDLLTWIGRQARFETYVVCLFRDDHAPEILADNWDDFGLGQEDRDKYTGWAYLLDPFFEAFQKGTETGLYHLNDVAPDRFRQSRYYKEYYRAYPLIDECAILVRLKDGEAVHLSLDRRSGSAKFQGRSLAPFRKIEPLIIALIEQHSAQMAVQVPLPASPTGGIRERIKTALMNFGSSVLSKRECEIVQLLFRGHSTKSIAEVLGIAPGTVMIHRGRIYDKLDVSSQSQLFALVIDVLSSQAAADDQDPLDGYLP